ncbi:Transcription antitermination protein NusB [subsurface metagenome]
MGARRKGRILALQALYSYDLSGAVLEDLLRFPWIDQDKLEKINQEALSFARIIIQGTIDNIKKVDNDIEEQLEHWDFARLNKVDLSILRISVYCLLFQRNIPPTVTIDEAIDIAREFGTDDSYRFINGVIDGIRKQQKL